MDTEPENEPGDGPRDVWTVGHSNQTLDDFLALLTGNGIDVLADVRSVPRSKFSPQFDSAELQGAVIAAGIRYAYFGDTLGGRPRGDGFYDAAGHVRYDLVAESRFFRDGLARLERGIARGFRIALMCSEEDPAVCHRHLLVGRVLAGSGYSLHHIRGDGRIESDADLERAGRSKKEAAAEAAGQGALFDAEEVKEEKPWRSIPSVLPKRAPRSSSEG